MRRLSWGVKVFFILLWVGLFVTLYVLFSELS
jgi:hypothetical protein